MPSGKAVAETQSRVDGDNWLAATLILGSVMNPINTTTMAVALTPIGIAFGASPAETAWLVSVFYLSTAVGQPVAGRLVDTVGARRTFLAASSVIAIAGALGTFAPSLWFLVGTRVLLALGTSAAYPAAMSVIRSESDAVGDSRQRALLTALAMSNQALAAVGPVVGGVLLSTGSWQPVFAINVPLALVCIGLGAWRIPRSQGGEPTTWRQLDPAGAILFTVSLVALMLCLMQPDRLLAYAAPVALAAGIALVVVERRATEPFLDVRLLATDRPLTLTFLRQALSLSASFCYVYGFTQWLDDVRGFGATTTGLMVAPLFVVSVLVSAILVRSRAIRARLVSGAVCSLAAGIVVLTMRDESPLALVISVSVLLGIAQGLNGPALQLSVFTQSRRERIGTSAGLLRTSGYLGAMVSAGAVAACFADAATLHGLHRLSLFMLGASALLLVVSLLDPAIRRPVHAKRNPEGAGAAVT
ncbi:MAG TPA: MFS transporter [Nocardioides sp.]|uniref:MFS transporter n=1 Tax=uncultured Nocardioides sp. TaxID=198441 RepID=UPI000ED92086|nr:MFS transporter [uncultured Nocardioides sp.]HCB05133.1 MFS transporter [Nocardioides sp.]HRD59824.1 MFS transporter [Nocardioides sp.]HRI94435.1 MFS transporter [Nocardioides sp.]HRK44413.1 MFS transporter [Nocardioides sp.]